MENKEVVQIDIQSQIRELQLNIKIPEDFYTTIVDAFITIVVKGTENLENGIWNSKKFLNLFTEGLKLLIKKIDELYLKIYKKQLENIPKTSLSQSQSRNIDMNPIFKISEYILNEAIEKYHKIYGEDNFNEKNNS